MIIYYKFKYNNITVLTQDHVPLHIIYNCAVTAENNQHTYDMCSRHVQYNPGFQDYK